MFDETEHAWQLKIALNWQLKSLASEVSQYNQLFIHNSCLWNVIRPSKLSLQRDVMSSLLWGEVNFSTKIYLKIDNLWLNL